MNSRDDLTTANMELLKKVAESKQLQELLQQVHGHHTNNKDCSMWKIMKLLDTWISSQTQSY